MPDSPVWTEAVSGKKKLWIQKYSDTCGLDLKWFEIVGF